MTPDFEDRLELGSDVLTYFFIFELVVKLVGLGVRGFFQDGMNSIDAFIVFSSVMEMIVGKEELKKLNITKTIKLLRVLRMVKLIHYIPAFHDMVAAIVKSLTALVWIVVLMLLVVSCFALMGMQLFGGKFNFPSSLRYNSL